MGNTKRITGNDVKDLSGKMKRFLSEMISENMELISENFKKLEPNQMMNALTKILPYLMEKEKSRESRERKVESRGEDGDGLGDDDEREDKSGLSDCLERTGRPRSCMVTAEWGEKMEEGGLKNGLSDCFERTGRPRSCMVTAERGEKMEKGKMTSVEQLKEMLARRRNREEPFYKQFDMNRRSKKGR